MQVLKNKKVVIASAAVLLLALVVIIILVMNSSSGGDKEEDGSVLVDTLGKGEDYETKVYITEYNHLLLKIKNARYINLCLKDEKEPIADTYTETELGSYDISYGVIFNLNDLTYETSDGASIYPCECELTLISAIAGIEYTIKLKVDEGVEYISGALECGKVNNSAVLGYDEFAKQYGELALPKKAIIKSLETKKGQYQIGDGIKEIEQGECTYILDGAESKLIILSSSNQDVLDSAKKNDGARSLSVKGVDVCFLFETSMYAAFFSQDDKIYISMIACHDGSKLKDKELIEKLEDFIK